ncbi:hypothetical protein [Mycoplasma parvum]|uniref:Uncharacterized protein n=1 Tax=Mycoplasma parvum str. Indiana TaxID=1403316 RepID=U5NG32_9MOLU|nr:hypothetical protein [Mycoplasma parvum]AGX89223.1 hypothetical protein PRV_02435 [Mycoplasma parvum str. Indiana]
MSSNTLGILLGICLLVIILGACYILKINGELKHKNSNNNEELNKETINKLNSLEQFSKNLQKQLFYEEKERQEREIRAELEEAYNRRIKRIEEERKEQNEIIYRLKEKIKHLTETQEQISWEKNRLERINFDLREDQKNHAIFIDFYAACKDWGLSEIEEVRNFIKYWRENFEYIEITKRKSKSKKGPQEGGKEGEKEWERLFKKTFEEWPSYEFKLTKQPRDQLGRRADFKIEFSSGKKYLDSLGVLKILIELKTSHKKFIDVSSTDFRELTEQIIKLLEETRYNNEKFDIALFIIGEKLIPQILGDEDVIWFGLGGERILSLEEYIIRGDPILALTSFEYSHILLKHLFYSWRIFAITSDNKIFSKSRDIKQFEERIPNLNRQALNLFHSTTKLKDELLEQLAMIIGELWKKSEELRHWKIDIDKRNEILKITEREVHAAIEWVRSITVKHDQSCTCDSCEQKRWIDKNCKEIDLFRKEIRRRGQEFFSLKRKIERKNRKNF